MIVFRSVAELAAAVGTSLGRSDWVVVDQRRIDLFAEATGDHQWIHVDPERAACGPFGATVAHGHLTLALVPMLTAQIYQVAGAAAGINYGSNVVRFVEPVRAGSRLRAHAELLDAAASGDGCRIVVRVTVELEGSTRPACVAEVISLWRGVL